MSLTTEQLANIIGKMDEKSAKTALLRIIRVPFTKKARGSVERALTGSSMIDVTKEIAVCHLAPDRTIPRSKLEQLTGSVVLDYAEEIIRAALDSRGPWQSREIMMAAANLKGGRAPFITIDGIPHTAKAQAGHILTMAGFERKSHYDHDTKKPIKAWKVRQGWAEFTVAQRVQIVFSTIQQELNPVAPKPQTTLGSFL